MRGTVIGTLLLTSAWFGVYVFFRGISSDPANIFAVKFVFCNYGRLSFVAV
jgi:hypothetical protein